MVLVGLEYVVECKGICLGVVLHEVACYGFILVFATDAAHDVCFEIKFASKEPVSADYTENEREAVELMVRTEMSRLRSMAGLT